MLKKIILSAVLLVSMNIEASVLKSQTDFKLKSQEKLHNQTDFRTLESLKEEQEKIKEIILKFNILEEALTGFEDKFLINKIKTEFMNKYLIDKADLLLIKQRINQQIKIKNNPKEDAEIFNVRD